MATQAMISHSKWLMAKKQRFGKRLRTEHRKTAIENIPHQIIQDIIQY